MSRKRVGINFHLFDGMFQGSRTFILELFSRVITISPDMDFFLFLENTEKLKDYDKAFAMQHVRLVRMPLSNAVKRNSLQLPLMQRKYRLDLLHSQYVVPMPSFSPCVLSIHDILYEKYPEYFNRIFRLRSRLLVRLSALRARHIITISEFSKSEIVSRYGVSPEKISVLYCGVDANKFHPGSDGIEFIRKRGLTEKNYILSVGRLEPRKNHVTLLKAYAELKSKPMPLVFAGKRDFKFAEIFETIKSLNIEKHVRIFEDVSDAELPALYRHAALFAYPTFAEGFGIPIVEAMSSGLPVISSNSTSIPEVLGKAGIAIDPCSSAELSSALEKLLSDEGLRRKMSRDSIERARTFSWDLAAEKTREIFLNAMSGGK